MSARRPAGGISFFVSDRNPRARRRFRLRNSALANAAMKLLRRKLAADAPIILMCRSGDRSAAAANLLAEAGFKNVYSVVDGYEGDLATEGPKTGQRAVNGWKNAGLPWSYKLDKAKMYHVDN